MSHPSAGALPETAKLGRAGFLAGFLVVGYLSMSRSFAYLGIQGLNIFIGEVALAWFLILGPREANGRWPWIALRARPLRGLLRIMFFFGAFGLFQVFRGWFMGHPPLTALRDFAFNYYPLYLFLGLYVGRRHPGFLYGLVRALAWSNGLYGLAYILFLNRCDWLIAQGPDVPLFGQPAGSAIALLGLLSTEKQLGRAWHLLLLNGFVLLGVQVRAEWVGFFVALLVWGFITKRFRRVGIAVVVILMLVAFLVATDFRIPAPTTRGGTISFGQIAGRALAAVDPDLAADYTADASSYAATITWRVLWWRAIWESVNENASHFLLGNGYGFPLADLVPYLQGALVRTPHNIFFFALGYGGWLGLILFCLFQLSIFRMLRRSFGVRPNAFGISYWVFAMTYGCFTSLSETPFGAIPFYLLTGIAIAPILTRARTCVPKRSDR